MIARNRVSSAVSSLALMFFSVFLYIDTTKHRHTLFPCLFFFFVLKREHRIHSVLCFAFSLPVSLRSFYFCTERASSFFLHCSPRCGWPILYITGPQRDGHFICFQAFAITNGRQWTAWSGPPIAPGKGARESPKWELSGGRSPPAGTCGSPGPPGGSAHCPQPHSGHPVDFW